MAFSKIFVTAVAAFSLAASVTAGPVGWNTDKYEPYDVYHARYNALDCKHHHNTSFFKKCCGPLHVGKTLSSRPAMCTPSTSSSVVATTTTSSNSTLPTGISAAVDVEVDGEEDCDDDEDEDDDDDVDCPDDDDDDDAASSDDGSSTTTLNPTPTTTTTPTSSSSTSTHKSTTTSTHKATSTGSSSGAEHTGVASFYLQGGAAGACGKVHKDSDLIAAINYHLYGADNKVSSWCGKQLQLTNTENGKTVTVTVADDCPSCDGSGGPDHASNIDLSKAAFDALGKESEGLLPITWVEV